MDYDQFVSTVRDEAGLGSRNEAERATRATLETLGSRLTEEEASDLAAQLPPELGQAVTGAPAGVDKFSLDEFFQRVMEREGLDDRAAAERHARTVLGVMSEAVTRGELDDVFSQLPKEFTDLLAPKDV